MTAISAMKSSVLSSLDIPTDYRYIFLWFLHVNFFNCFILLLELYYQSGRFLSKMNQNNIGIPGL